MRSPRTTPPSYSGSDPISRPARDAGPLPTARGEGADQIPDGFVAVAKVSELLPGKMKWVAVKGQRRVVANVNGVFYAISDVCGHRNAPLSRGRLDGYLIECPLHYAQFDVRTGELVNGPVSTAIATYDVRVEGDTIFVRR